MEKFIWAEWLRGSTLTVELRTRGGGTAFFGQRSQVCEGGEFHRDLSSTEMILDAAESKKTAAASEISDKSVQNVLVESGANQ